MGIRWLKGEIEQGKVRPPDMPHLLLNIRIRWQAIGNGIHDQKGEKLDKKLKKNLNWMHQQIAGITALAWLVILEPPGRKQRKTILPVSSNARPKYRIGGRTVSVNYSGMEGKNGAASISYRLQKNRWNHYDVEIDGAEQEINHMRARVFSRKEEAIAWYNEQTRKT
ncbi:hypothetical protein KKC88_01045 [Patescibacteria group bacterium]|nr:hypothetical protein [Patescibacteria group bacterium]